MKRRRLESMNRLTERFNNGQAAVMGCGENCKYDYKYCRNHYEECPEINKIYERLAEYEDTGLTPAEITGKMEALRIYKEQGLTPDQIAELKERDTAKAPIDVDEDYGFFTCPSCGEAIYASDDFESHKFCLNCGQRLKFGE